MSETLALSRAQADALEKARSYGALERWPGGYWSHPGCAFNSGKPAWRCTTGTVKALMQRGLLRYSEWKPTRQFRYPTKVEPT